MAADGTVGADLEVGPAEFILNLLVALLDPVPQPVEPHDLRQSGRGERRLVERSLEPPDAAVYARDVDEARTHLGPAEFAAAWAEGQAMTLDQAVAYALEAPGAA